MTSRQAVLAVALLSTACGGGGSSVLLEFPTEPARAAAKRLWVRFYDPADSGGGCERFAELAAEGDRPAGAATAEGFFDYPLAESAEVSAPPGRSIVYVLGYTSSDADAVPYLEGCTDRFDTEGEHEEVLVDLHFVLPASARVVKVAGDRQVAGAGGDFGRPLVAAVRATPPDGRGQSYEIPGVPFVFEAETSGFSLGDAQRLPVDAGTDGRASAIARAPATRSTGRILARTALLSDRPEAAEVAFSLSVRAPPGARASTSLEGHGATAVDAALGDFVPGAGVDLVVVGCDAAGACDDRTEPGTTVIRRFEDIATAARALPPLDGAGVAPFAVRVTPIRDARAPSIVVASRFRTDSEGAALYVVDGDTIERHTMTASNAVALVELETLGRSERDVAVVATGRRDHLRPCLDNSSLCKGYDLPECTDTPEVCGCPAGEYCGCIDCSAGSTVGVCIAQDERLDVLGARPQADGALYNRGGCQEPRVDCNNDVNALVANCACADVERGARCVVVPELCMCRIPAFVRIGVIRESFEPRAAAAAVLTGGSGSDVVVLADSRIGFLRYRSALDYDWEGGPTMNGRFDGLVVAPIDHAVDGAPDVVWFAREACTAGFGFEQNCPVTGRVSPSETARGCLGLHTTDGASSILDAELTPDGACRRLELDIAPDDLCAGDFNADGDVDLAVTAHDIHGLLVLVGDGLGGFSYPPERIETPVNGGILACGDVDGTGGDDIVVVDAATGAASVLVMSAAPP